MTAFVAGDRLKRALSRSAREADLRIEHVAEKCKPWSSCSFVGGTHEIVITAQGQDEQRVREWLGGLGDRAVHVPGYALAELVVSSMETASDIIIATIDAMSIEET